jgi:NADH-quinone oxidoreductase subunit K
VTPEQHALAEIHLLENYLLIGGLLFAIGLIGFLSRRNMIVMFLAAEMMLQGVSVSLVGWGRFHNDWGGQALVIFILTVAACEAAIALALVQMLFYRGGNLDIALWQNLREANQPRYMDREIPPSDDEKLTFPKLTPSGIDPNIQEEETIHRTHV